MTVQEQTDSRRVYTEIFSDEYGAKMGGYVMGIDVNGGQAARAVPGPNNQPMHTVSGVRLTAELRELERDNVVLEMHDNPDRVSAIADQQADGKTYPAVQYRGFYGNFIVLFDPMTSLPAVVRTRDFDYYYGDINYDETLSDWREVANGVKMPYHRLITANGTKIFDTTIQSIAFNPQIPVDAFTVPAALRRKAAGPAPQDQVKWQWILRRMGNGFYADSDALTMPTKAAPEDSGGGAKRQLHQWRFAQHAGRGDQRWSRRLRSAGR